MISKNLQKQVYNAVKTVPKGMVTTYGEISQAIGLKSSRLIGKILSLNTDFKSIPCYKVVKSNGHVSGYNQGINKKIRLLKADGITVKNFKIVNFKEKLFKFSGK